MLLIITVCLLFVLELSLKCCEYTRVCRHGCILELRGGSRAALKFVSEDKICEST